MHGCGLYPPARKRILLFNGLQVGESIHRHRRHTPPDLPGGATSSFEWSEKSRALPEHFAPAARCSPTRQDGQRDCRETRAIESGPGVGGKIDPQLPTQSLIAMLSELFDDPENVRVTNRPVEIGEPKAPRAKSPKRVTCFAYANHGTRLRETRSPTTLPASPPPQPISAKYWRIVVAMVLMGKGDPLENQAQKNTQSTTNKQLAITTPPGKDWQSRLRARKRLRSDHASLTPHSISGNPVVNAPNGITQRQRCQTRPTKNKITYRPGVAEVLPTNESAWRPP